MTHNVCKQLKPYKSFFIKDFLIFTPPPLHSRVTGHNAFNQISYQGDCIIFIYTRHIYNMGLKLNIHLTTVEKKIIHMKMTKDELYPKVNYKYFIKLQHTSLS